MDAIQYLLHLHSCEQEGISSGMPTPQQWIDAVEAARKQYAEQHSALTKEQEELLNALKETEEQLRWLYNNAEFEGHMPIRSAIDKANEVIQKYSPPVKK